MNIHRYPESGHVHPYPTGEDVLDPSLPAFRVWVPKEPMLVLGYSQEVAREFNLDAVLKRNLPVYKRKGGGGAVLLTAGNVCVALRFRRNPAFGIREYFSTANEMIKAVFKEQLKLDLDSRGTSDLALQDRKVLGCSLYLPRGYAVYLASILVNADLSLMDELLRYPSREPDYRHGRSHAAFVQNLVEMPGMKSMTPGRLRDLLEAGLSDNPDLDRG